MLAAKSSTLCVLLCLGLATADISTVFDKDQAYNFHEDSLMSVNFYNSRLAVITCDDEKCNISYTTVDSRKPSASCEVVLDQYEYDITGHPFTADKAILVSRTRKENREQYVKYVVIDFRDCVKAEVKISFESFAAAEKSLKENRNAILINEDETFDVLYYDAKACGDKLCRLTLDAQGNKVTGPIAYFVPLYGSFRYVKKVPSSSSFIVTELKESGEDYNVSLVKADGQVQVLKQLYKNKDVDYPTYHDVSVSHELIRLCSKTNTTKVDCDLFNDSGKLTSRISVNLAQNVETVAVKNLANGVFLLMADGEESGAVLKVKDDIGLVFGVAKLSRFSTDEYESYIDVGDSRYCVTRKVCGNYNKIKKECYSDDDFEYSRLHD